MTFTEAAVEVLRSAGKPLHYKKITEIAIEKNLLSHVGKTPETTMSSRLATMVKKDRGDAPILKVKPGVFALRDFPEDAVEEAASDDSDSDAPEAPEQKAGDEDGAAPLEADEAEEEILIVAQELPGADVFPEEDDDDDLILANLDDDSRDGRRPRKRRPRRRRERDAEGAPTAEARPERRPAARSRTRKEPPAPAHRAAEAGEPVGRDLSDAIETALRGGSRKPRTLVQVAEALIDTGRLAGTPSLLAPTLGAAVRGDNAKRRASGGRPRFREADGLVALLEWDLPSDAVNAERDALRAADRQRQGVRRALIKRLRDLPDGALLELLATWLNAVGVHSLRGVRADAGDFSLAGTLRRGPEETPLAITIFRGNQPIHNDAVVALRGGLHHFDHARVGWLITLGQVREGTLGEAHAEGAAPCAVFDGDALAVSMEEVGVGIHRASLPLAVLDVELLDSLAGGAPRIGSSAAATASAEENGDSDNKRRRSRRRGRRRGGRAEEGEEGSRDESVEASDASDGSESADSEPAKLEAESESTPQPAEDTEKTPADLEPAPEAEVEQL
ncbi:MAG: winged helix-turn-helix domain-containing protein [Polyangiales bacterium]